MCASNKSDVDDDENKFIACIIITYTNYSCFAATEGEEALRFLTRQSGERTLTLREPALHFSALEWREKKGTSIG